MAYDPEAAAAAVPPPEAMSGEGAPPATGDVSPGFMAAFDDFEAAQTPEARALALKDAIHICMNEYGKK